MLRPKWLKYAKDLSQKHRSYRKFYHAMNSDSTISTYSYSLKRFMDYLVSVKEIRFKRNLELATRLYPEDLE